jgi:hypothetical protein
MYKNNQFGLDWWANSEHGGERTYDGNRVYWDDTSVYPAGTILGVFKNSGGHQVMYRWQSLRDFAFPDILRNRKIYPDKRIFSGLEWNVPGHEHCSTGIVASDASAISVFEFQFDKSDSDTSRIGEVTPYGTLVKMNGRDPSTQATKPSAIDRHTDSVAAAAWMQKQYKDGKIGNGWIVFAHIERAGAFKTGSSDGGYNIEHFRDFNNAAPDVCFGFESAPGHQVNYQGRGGFSTGAFGGIFGGVGFYTAQVGGLWDALLGEGRRWFNYASSDYHKHWTNCDDPANVDSCGDDFYPGEYQKTYVFTKNGHGDGKFSRDDDHNEGPSLNTIMNGLRSGNTFFVHGDLINHLEFTAKSGFKEASMGGELRLNNKWFEGPLFLTIKFKSPKFNNNGKVPVVHHIDLIAGKITGKVDPSSPDYTKATNESTEVVDTFTATDVITYRIPELKESMYFRLRGTNLAPDTPNETDADGNPLADSLIITTTPQAQANAVWKDLWFYSNPIFVYVR